MQRIYLDYAATTPVDKEVLAKMLPYFTEHFENPSALYSQKIKYDIEHARKQVAGAIDAKPAEITFTSGGTEANNLAILGTGRLYRQAHFITCQLEHDSVLQSFAELEKEGHQVTYLPVDANGRISLTELEEAILPDTKLISIMSVNNEIGVIQDIKGISEIARRHQVLFHTDAVQALGQLEVKAEWADFITLSGHKIYGPKGIGALYIAKGSKLMPLLVGGHQESGKRSGTENVTGIIGFGYAAELASSKMTEQVAQQQSVGRHLCERMQAIEGVKRNGAEDVCASHIYHFSLSGIKTEVMLTLLDMAGISISAGSACQAGSYRVSHVMKALADEEGNGHIRVSIGNQTTIEEIDRFVSALQDIVVKLRKG